MKLQRLMQGMALSALVTGAALLPTPSMAASILGGSIIVQQDGNVTATFQGSNAGYTSSLYLGNTKLFTSNQAAGTTVNLGNFSAGTELTFRLEVHNTGHTFFSGAGANNIDGIAHALVDDSFGANETLVSFEDLLGGGDRDYNDLLFSFSNTGADTEDGSSDPNLVQNPEPSTVILLGSGLAGLAAWRARRNRAGEK